MNIFAFHRCLKYFTELEGNNRTAFASENVKQYTELAGALLIIYGLQDGSLLMVIFSWIFVPCGCGQCCRRFGGICHMSYVRIRCSVFFQNVGNHILDYTGE
jgi:hypothetical protein